MRLANRGYVIVIDKKYSIDQISDIYDVERDRVAEWMNRWSESQLTDWLFLISLDDKASL